MCPSLRVGPVILFSVIRDVIPSCRVSRQRSMCCAPTCRSGPSFSEDDFARRPPRVHRQAARCGRVPAAGRRRHHPRRLRRVGLPAQLRHRRQGQGAHRPVRPGDVVARRLQQPQHRRALAVLHRRDRGLRAAADRRTVASGAGRQRGRLRQLRSAPACRSIPRRRTSASSARSVPPPRSDTCSSLRPTPRSCGASRKPCWRRTSASRPRR